MSDVTRILGEIEQGEPHAGEQLLPLVYDELRKLAAQKAGLSSDRQRVLAAALPASSASRWPVMALHHAGLDLHSWA